MKKNHPHHQDSMYKGAPAESFAKAKLLRENMTPAEKVLWEKLKDGQMQFKFRRQHPIHIFIVDFYCHKLKLVIEVDGDYHQTDEQKVRDSERSVTLEFQGLEVLRFTNDQVLNQLGFVMEQIYEKILSLTE